MVRRSGFPWTLATLALLGLAGQAAWADPIAFTGNAANDFNPNTNSSVDVLPVDANPLLNIAETPYMLANNRITGWAVKDVRLAMGSSGTLSVGVNSYGIAGDADGNGNPGAADPNDSNFQHGGQDLPNFGGTKSITLALAGLNASNPSQPGTPILVAGVPGDKSTAGSGLDGFTVASYAGKNAGIEDNYGATLTGHVGNLAFNPSASTPDFEFTIPNFTSIPGLNASSGFWVKLYSGSADDGAVGEENTAWIRVPALAAESIPEPSTWLAWTLLGAGAAWQARKKTRHAALGYFGSH
jgi:hypothetical protein